MAGRAQAANLTGMLSQLAADVGKRGQASDWTHNNIRDYAAPEVDDNSFESLSNYADWAQRNGKQDIADKYRAAALQQKKASEQIGFKKSMAQSGQQIRDLQTAISNIQRAPRDDNELYSPKQLRINQMTDEMNALVKQMNTLGQESIYGTGVEGDEILRTLSAESAANFKSGVDLANARANLSKNEGELAKRQEQPIWEAANTNYQNQANALVNEIVQLRMMPGSASGLEAKEADLAALRSQWEGDANISLNGDSADVGKYIDGRFNDANQNVRQALEQRAKVEAAQNARSAEAGTAWAVSLMNQGVYELTPVMMKDAKGNPLPSALINAAQAELNDGRAQRDRLEEAASAGYVDPNILSYAENEGKNNPAIASALDSYSKATAPDSKLYEGQVNQAATGLTTLVHDHMNDRASKVENMGRRESIIAFTDIWANHATTRAWSDDLLEDIDETNREDFIGKIMDYMDADGIKTIDSAEQYADLAIRARTDMGLNTDSDNLASVVESVETGGAFAAAYQDHLEEERARLTKEEPNLTPEAVDRRARKAAKTVVDAFNVFTSLNHNNQLDGLKFYPQQFAILFNNDEEDIASAIKWLEDNPGRQLTYKDWSF